MDREIKEVIDVKVIAKRNGGEEMAVWLMRNACSWSKAS